MKTVERYCQKGPESLGHQGGMDHWPRKMETSLQDPLRRTGRRLRNVRKVRQLFDNKHELWHDHIEAERKVILVCNLYN